MSALAPVEINRKIPRDPQVVEAGMKVKLIANPAAGRKAPEKIAAIRARLLRAGCAIDITITGGRGDAEEAAAAAAVEDWERILVAGGDGTLNEAINGLVPSPIPLGFVPLGTANVLALETGIPGQIADAVDLFLHGCPKRVSTGTAGRRRFLLMAGIGFDAATVHGMNPLVKRLSGKLAYAVSGLQVFCRGPAAPMTVTLENGARISAQGLILGNVKRYGGGFLLFPEAALEEPLLDVCLFRRLSRTVLVRCLWRLARGARIDSPDILRFKTKQAFVEGEKIPVQVDGDPEGTLPMSFASSTDELWLVMPPEKKPAI